MQVHLGKMETAMAMAKRMVFLAYKACGGASGMGFLQEMRLGGIPASENEVWKCAYNQEDYPMKHSKSDEVYCDYVFGRMMKWGCSWDENGILDIPDRSFSHDYQSFSRTYPDNNALVTAAASSLGIDLATYEVK